MRKVLAIYGTRPEAIKMAPIVRQIERSSHLDIRVAVTGQHRELLDQVNSLFGIRARARPRHHPAAAVARGDHRQRPRRPGGGDPGRSARHGRDAGRHHDVDGRRVGGVLPACPRRARRGRAADVEPVLAVPGGDQQAADGPAGEPGPRTDAGGPREPHRGEHRSGDDRHDGQHGDRRADRRGGARRSVHRPAAPPAARSSRRARHRPPTRVVGPAHGALGACARPAGHDVPGRLLRAPDTPEPGGSRGAAARAGTHCPTS